MARTPEYWKQATRELSERDPVLAEIISRYDGEMLKSEGNAFRTLTQAIVGQQISVKAADSIWNRLEAGLGKVTPQTMHSHPDDAMRAYGLSRQKVLYLKDIAHHFLEGMDPDHWHHLEDDEVVKSLIHIKGIGRWTAEMFLIFYLLRPNVFPVADLGLMNAISRHYGKGRAPSKTALTKLSKRWQPWRTVATWYLWRSLDPVPVEY